jgi:hypothetical protein
VGSEQQEAFDALKDYIQKLPMLASQQPDQPLILYVSATHTAINEPLCRKEKYQKRVESYHTKSQYILFPKLSPAPKNITQKWRRCATL